MKKEIDKISIHKWFAQTISRVVGKNLSGSPIEILNSINCPIENYSWLINVENNVYPISEVNHYPSLESKKKSIKRKTGQFYTPENLVELLISDETINEKHYILDPSCGSGNFLVPIARNLISNGEGIERLCGFDIDSEALLVCLARLLRLSKCNSWPRLEQKNYLYENIENSFDYVVGNPPYKVNLSEKEKKLLSKIFTTSEGEKDLYTFFIEAGFKALKQGGKLILLTSNTYLVNHHCKKIREFVFNKNTAKELFFLPYRFFSYAPGVLPVILKAKKLTSAGRYKVQIHSEFELDYGWHSAIKANSDSLCNTGGLRSAFLPQILKNNFKKMDSSKLQLGDIAKVRVGIQESSKRGNVISKFVSDVKVSDSFKPVLKGREIESYKINWEGRYINYGPHLVYAGNPDIYENPKIVYQNIRNEKLPVRLVAALDKDSYYPKNSLTTISSVNEKFSLKFILALMNSLLVNTWFSSKYFSFHITVTQVKTIPVPEYDYDMILQIEHLVDKIIEMKKRNQNTSKLEDSINNILLRMFFLDVKEEEFNQICHNFLEQALRL